MKIILIILIVLLSGCSQSLDNKINETKADIAELKSLLIKYKFKKGFAVQKVLSHNNSWGGGYSIKEDYTLLILTDVTKEDCLKMADIIPRVSCSKVEAIIPLN